MYSPFSAIYISSCHGTFSTLIFSKPAVSSNSFSFRTGVETTYACPDWEIPHSALGDHPNAKSHTTVDAFVAKALVRAACNGSKAHQIPDEQAVHSSATNSKDRKVHDSWAVLHRRPHRVPIRGHGSPDLWDSANAATCQRGPRR